jgi:hypothetical protein
MEGGSSYMATGAVDSGYDEDGCKFTGVSINDTGETAEYGSCFDL